MLLLAGAAAFQSALKGPFIFDDFNAIVRNANAHVVWPLSRSLVAPSESSIAGRPLVSLTFALNYHFGGLDTTGYRLVNVCIHLLAAITLFGLLRRTFLAPALAPTFGRHATALALVCALIWELHPLTTESVAYIVNRTESLMSLMLLLTLYCVARAAGSRQRQTLWTVGAVTACIAGMASKEVMFVCPLLALLYDRLAFAGSFVVAWRRRWGMYVLLFTSSAIVPLLLFTTVAFRSKSGAGFERMNAWENLLTQSGVLTHYLRLAIWPDKLVIDYDDWPPVRALGAVLPNALLVFSLLCVATVGLVRGRAWSLPLIWFFLILAPTSSFIPLGTEIAAERRMYMPLVAVVASLVCLVYLGLRKASEAMSPAAQGRWVRGALVTSAIACAVVIAISAGVATAARNRVYHTSMSIFEDAIRKRPMNARAWVNYGLPLWQERRLDEAVAAYRRAVELKPDSVDAHVHYGAILLQEGIDVPTAEQHLKYALSLDSHEPSAALRLGVLYLDQGDLAQAEEMLSRAMQRKPDWAEAESAMGELRLAQGRREEALAHHRRAVELHPIWDQGHYKLGEALFVLGDPRGAISAFEEARKLSPGRLDVTDLLAEAYARAGRFADAVTTAETAREQAQKVGRVDLVRQLDLRIMAYRSGRTG